MQPNVITLSVDEQNDGVGPVNHVFTRFDEYQNRSVYTSATHSMALKDTMSLYRTMPKASGNFRGVMKSAIKFSQDILVTGVDGVSQLSAPIIVDISFSIPVGATPAQTMIARQRALSALDFDTVMAPLNDLLMV